jgi:hypothetical protein
MLNEHQATGKSPKATSYDLPLYRLSWREETQHYQPHKREWLNWMIFPLFIQIVEQFNVYRRGLSFANSTTAREGDRSTISQVFSSLPVN